MRHLCLSVLLGLVTLSRNFAARAAPGDTCFNLKGVNYCWDGDYYYLPENGGQVVADTDAGTYDWNDETMFRTEGAMMKKIQVARDGKTIKAIKFVDYKDNEWAWGDVALLQGETQYYTFQDGEVIRYLQQQGNEGKLCKLYIETSLGTRYTFGADDCGGDNKGTNDVMSGIIGQIFGRSDGQKIYTLGILFVRDIRSVSTETSDITNIPGEPYLYESSSITVNATNSGDYESTKNYSYEEKLDFYNSYSTYRWFSFNFTANVQYKWESVSSSLDTDFTLKLAYIKSSESLQTSSTSTTAKYETSTVVCCPGGYYCVWSIGQAAGSIPASNAATAHMYTTVTLDTDKTITYNDEAPFDEDVIEKSQQYVTLTFYDKYGKPVNSGTDELDNGIWDGCSSSGSERRRRLTQDSTAVAPLKQTTFTQRMGYPLKRDIDLLSAEVKFYIKNQAMRKLKREAKIPGDIDIDWILQPIFEAANLKIGSVIMSDVTQTGFIDKV